MGVGKIQLGGWGGSPGWLPRSALRCAAMLQPRKRKKWKEERKRKWRRKQKNETKVRGCQARSSTGTRAKARSGSRLWPGAGHRCDQLSRPAGVLLIGLSRPRTLSVHFSLARGGSQASQLPPPPAPLARPPTRHSLRIARPGDWSAAGSAQQHARPHSGVYPVQSPTWAVVRPRSDSPEEARPLAPKASVVQEEKPKAQSPSPPRPQGSIRRGGGATKQAPPVEDGPGQLAGHGWRSTDVTDVWLRLAHC